MKSIRNFTSLLVTCGIAIAMVSSLAAQTVEGKATVVRIKGSARFSQNGSWTPLKVGDVLRAGTVVQTGMDKGSYVDLVLLENGSATPLAMNSVTPPLSDTDVVTYKPTAEQNVVRLNEDTALGIDKLTSQQTGADLVTETQLDLKKGRITGRVKKLSPASKYEIKIPNGVAGIRGTLYDLTAEGVLRVAIGSVVLAYVGPNGEVVTQVVSAGQQFDSRSGQLTPLSASIIEWLNSIGAQMIVRAPTGNGRTSVVVEPTLPVSPTQGQSQNGNQNQFGEPVGAVNHWN